MRSKDARADRVRAAVLSSSPPLLNLQSYLFWPSNSSTCVADNKGATKDRQTALVAFLERMPRVSPCGWTCTKASCLSCSLLVCHRPHDHSHIGLPAGTCLRAKWQGARWSVPDNGDSQALFPAKFLRPSPHCWQNLQDLPPTDRLWLFRCISQTLRKVRVERQGACQTSS